MACEVRMVRPDDPAFLALCEKLDAYLDRMAGGAENRKQYTPYNNTAALEAAFLALAGGRPIGGAGLKRAAADTGEIKRMYVVESGRGQGAGGALIEALEAEARKRGCKNMVLETGEHLVEAMRLYARYGYAVIPPYGPYAAMEPSKISICMGKVL